MTESEFDKRFDLYQREHYASYDDTGKDLQTKLKDWRERAHDSRRRAHLMMTLLEYARDCRMVGNSRKKNNLPQRIFDELGVDPLVLEFSKSTRKLLNIPEETA